MRVLAAGLSPAWQQTVVVDALHVGEVNRAGAVYWCASGKVLNVGLALHTLAAAGTGAADGATCAATLPNGLASPLAEQRFEKGGQAPRETLSADRVLPRDGASPRFSTVCLARTLALIGGDTGAAIEGDFATLGVAARWVRSAQPTRVCTTILETAILESAGGRTTELVENPGEISAAELAAFCEAFREEARNADAVVLTGSFPAGTPATLYRDLLRETRARAVIDAQGPPLLAALAARPAVVKPNREELGRTLGRTLATDSDLHAAMRELNARGAEWVVVTHGRERVWIASATGLWAIDPPRTEAVNPIGSGDALAAGLALGLAGGVSVPDAVTLGVAAACANVQTLLPARFDREVAARVAGGLRCEERGASCGPW